MSKIVHQPTKESREVVKLHAMIGTRQEVISDILCIDEKTLRKYYREELDQSKSKANATIGGALFNKAKGGDTTAMIFWMKTQAGWKDSITIGGDPSNPLRMMISEIAGKTLGPNQNG